MNCCYWDKKVGRVSAFLVIMLLALFSTLDAHAKVTANTPKGGEKQTSAKTQKNTFNTPDFAFPETVSKNADVQLKKALDSGNECAALKAAIQLNVSRDLVSNNSYPETLALYRKLASELRAPYSQLAILLEAQLYKSIYESSPYLFNNRVIPTSPVPENVMEWNRDIFANEVTELISAAFAESDLAKSTPLSAIASIIESAAEFEKMDASVFDFMVLRAIDILWPFAKTEMSAETIPFTSQTADASVDRTLSPSELYQTLIDSCIESHLKKNEMKIASALCTYKIDRLPWNKRTPIVTECIRIFGDTPYCANFILGAINHNDTEFLPTYACNIESFEKLAENNKRLKYNYSLISSYLKKFPDCDNNQALSNKLNELSAEVIAVNLPERVYPGKEWIANVSADNIFSFNLLTVKLPDSYSDKTISLNKIKTAGKVVNATPIQFTGSIPMHCEGEISFPALKSGVYALIPSHTATIEGMIVSSVPERQIATFTISRLAAFIFDNNYTKDSNLLYVVDAENQKPVSGATVTFSQNNKQTKHTKTTSADGCVSVPTGSYNVLISKGVDKLSTNAWSWNSESGSKERLNARILTDLSIYHPGDSVGFTGILYREKERVLSMATDRKIRMILLDANYQGVDTIRLATDRFGRVAGYLEIPKTGLLGTYSIKMLPDSDDNLMYGNTFIEVADYKSPTFTVTVENEGNSFNTGDTIRFNGNVKTYSGMPLAGATVNYDITTVFNRLFANKGNATFGGSTTTDADGTFTINLSTDKLRGTEYAFCSYEMNITATSPSGETHEAPAEWFSIGNAYSISAEIPDRISKSGNKNEFAVRVLDMAGHPVVRTIYYRISADNNKSAYSAGKFESPIFKFDYKGMGSGKYTVTFSLNEDFKDTATEKSQTVETVIYDPHDKQPPFATPLWAPVNEIVSEPEAKTVKVSFGSGYNDSYIFVTVSDCNRLIEQKWVHCDNAMTSLDVPAPSNNNRTFVTLTGMHRYNTVSSSVTIIPAIQKESVKITTLSFRDRITPGAHEKWNFRFSLNNEALAGIPVSAVMSNFSLNAIAPFKWNFNPDGSIYYSDKSSISPNYINAGGRWRISLAKLGNLATKSINFPNWDLYGYSLYGGSRNSVMIRGRFYSSKAKATNARPEGVMELSSVSVTSAKMAAGATMDSADEAIVVESTDSADNGTSDNSDEIPLRNVEYPLAFFMPALQTDSNGEVDIDFVAPQFIGAWQLQLAGYTENLKGATIAMNIVSSKPVMVQMNAPRFVRTGDTLSIASMLFNNSIDTQSIAGRIELFDPLSDKLLNSYQSESYNIKPAESHKIASSFSIPSDINFLGIRVYAEGKDFADGEQTVIPVYPSSTPVIESTTFYLAPSQNNISIKVPTKQADARVTLQYCDNPVWEVVTALPEIAVPKSAGALTLANSLYGNAVSAGLVKEYPEIAEALQLFASPKNAVDSTLYSNLQKNQDLKAVMLNNTPWVCSAESETLRMHNLIRYADSQECSQTIASIAKELAKLQNADGGWSWCSNMQSSQFITTEVLQRLAMLKSLGYLPELFTESVEKGVKYADAQWVKNLNEYKGKKFPYISMMSYLYARSAFNLKTDASFAAMQKKGIEAVKVGWKNLDIHNKAIAAVLLYRNGYAMEARTILESLKQYASTSTERGMWFDNLSSISNGYGKLLTTSKVLEAYSEISPESPCIDKLREWLILEKQVQNWGDSSSTSEVIQSILTSGSKWTTPAFPPTIVIGDKQIEPDRFATLTGSITTMINTDGTDEITIHRSGNGPAWGGIISQFVAPIKDVENAASSELSIEKNIYVISTDGAGTTAFGSNLKVGDKVRVTLTLKCNRDMDYVAVIDARSCCLEPTEQLSEYTVSDGVWMYREVRNDATNLFIPFLSKGTHVISYDCYVDRAGDYSLGIATAQSQYYPAISAHSAGRLINVTQ